VDNKKLEKLHSLLSAVNNSLTKQEFIESFKAVSDYVKRIEDKNNDEFSSFKSKFDALSKLVKEESANETENLKSQVNSLVNTHLVSIMQDFEKKVADIDAKLLEVKDGKDGEDGEDGDSVEIEEVITEVLKRIPDPPIDEGVNIVDKINSITGDSDRDKIDAIHIKNLPEFVEKVSQGSGLRNVFHDTTLTGTGTVADPLSVVDSGGGSGVTESFVIAMAIAL